MGWESAKYQIVPECCEAMRASMAVVLTCDLLEEDGMSGGFGEPHWHLRIHYNLEMYGRIDSIIAGDRFYEAVGHPACCPFCSQKLPEIRLKPANRIPKKICAGTDGYYCNTCNQRNMGCTCAPPWMRWEIVPSGQSPIQNLSKLVCEDCGKELDAESAFVATTYETDGNGKEGYCCVSRHVRVCAACLEPRRKANDEFFRHDGEKQ